LLRVHAIVIERALTLAAVLAGAVTSSVVAQSDADALFKAGDFSPAATAYRQRLTANPSDAGAELNLGAIRLYQNDLTAAAPLLRAAASADPQNPRAAVLLKELQRRTDEAARRTTVSGEQSIVPFVVADPLPVVRVVANGKAANLVVDTGGDVDLEPDFATRVGVTMEAGTGTGVFAGGKTAAVRSGKLHSLGLGSATAYDVPVHVLPTHAGALFAGLHVDGIVGTTFFERFLVTMDYPQKRLVLRPRSKAASQAFQAAAAQAGAAVVPCYLVGDHFVMARAQVNDAPAPPGLFLFDSGLAGGGVMPTAELMKAAGITIDESRSQTGMGGGGTVQSVPFTASRVAVGSAVQHDVPGQYTPQGTPLTRFPFTVWGFISNDFLKHYAYTVDFDAMTIVLQ
jgi:Aspartyl protease